ncbi:MAG: prolipoprotein diacylglyceryl transferase [Myxococcales bacterium]|nr:prolipoprotein diacylglyceryl transferase [Myxococcales bacterium]
MISSLASAIPAFPIDKVEGWISDTLPVPLHVFGLVVAIGVIIGAEIARRHSWRYNVHDDDFRGLSLTVVVTGFIGAHVFDVLFYQWDDFMKDPMLIVKIWAGISSYGGFIGGALGFFGYTWFRRLNTGLFADSIMLGLLPGFTIGRLACTLASDHVGSETSFVLGFDYPAMRLFGFNGPVRLHNLGFYELLYLIPVCAIVLWLGFRSKKRLAAGSLAVLTGLLYAPVRFALDYLRFDKSDPRYLSLTFAQWMSIVAFIAAGYVFLQLRKHGKPAPTSAELGDKVGGRLTA